MSSLHFNIRQGASKEKTTFASARSRNNGHAPKRSPSSLNASMLSIRLWQDRHRFDAEQMMSRRIWHTLSRVPRSTGHDLSGIEGNQVVGILIRHQYLSGGRHSYYRLARRQRRLRCVQNG